MQSQTNLAVVTGDHVSKRDPITETVRWFIGINGEGISCQILFEQRARFVTNKQRREKNKKQNKKTIEIIQCAKT